MGAENMEVLATLRAIDDAFAKAVARLFTVYCSALASASVAGAADDAASKFERGLEIARRARIEARHRVTGPLWKEAGER